MPTTNNYYSIIIKILKQYQNTSNQYQNVESRLIVDEESRDFLIFVYGRHNTEPVHECLLHIQIDGNKILIRRNDLKLDLLELLTNEGISSLNIIYPDIPERIIKDYSVSLEKIYKLHSSLFELQDNFTKALKPDVPSTELVKLAKIGHQYLNCALASHPNTPPDLLEELFPKFPVQVLTNPVMDLLLLERPKFIEDLYRYYHAFFPQKKTKDPEWLRKWAIEQKQKDITQDESFLPDRITNCRSRWALENLWKHSILPLNTKNNPSETMRSLYKVLDSLFGDRQVEYEPDFEELEARQLPLPLKYLYAFIGKYPGGHGGWLSTQDALLNGGAIWQDKRVFLSENQAVWHCGTELEGYDPPVWINIDRSDCWEYLCDSLTEFLVTYCFQETLSADSCQNAISYLEKKGYKTTFIWQGVYASNVQFAKEFNNRRNPQHNCHHLQDM